MPLGSPENSTPTVIMMPPRYRPGPGGLSAPPAEAGRHPSHLGQPERASTAPVSVPGSDSDAMRFDSTPTGETPNSGESNV